MFGSCRYHCLPVNANDELVVVVVVVSVVAMVVQDRGPRYARELMMC